MTCWGAGPSGSALPTVIERELCRPTHRACDQETMRVVRMTA